MRARPFSVLGRPVHLSRFLPLITTRWFSSSPSDLTSRRAPCPPKSRRWRLQVSLSVSRLSPSCLNSLSIPFHPLWPVRNYPHLRISARGPGLSGTSTHLTRQLSGAHYGGVRLLMLVHHRLRLLAFPMRTRSRNERTCWPTMRSPGSHTRSVRTCQGLRPRRAGRALALACPSVLPSTVSKASAPGIRPFSRLNSLAYALPCRRFAEVLADTCARLGADVVRYSFIAVDSHPLLLAGLPAHSQREYYRLRPFRERMLVIRHAKARAGSCLTERWISAPGRKPKFERSTGLSHDGGKAGVGRTASCGFDFAACTINGFFGLGPTAASRAAKAALLAVVVDGANHL